MKQLLSCLNIAICMSISAQAADFFCVDHFSEDKWGKDKRLSLYKDGKSVYQIPPNFSKVSVKENKEPKKDKERIRDVSYCYGWNRNAVIEVDLVGSDESSTPLLGLMQWNGAIKPTCQKIFCDNIKSLAPKQLAALKAYVQRGTDAYVKPHSFYFSPDEIAKRQKLNKLDKQLKKQEKDDGQLKTLISKHEYKFLQRHRTKSGFVYRSYTYQSKSEAIKDLTLITDVYVSDSGKLKYLLGLESEHGQTANAKGTRLLNGLTQNFEHGGRMRAVLVKNINHRNIEKLDKAKKKQLFAELQLINDAVAASDKNALLAAMLEALS